MVVGYEERWRGGGAGKRVGTVDLDADASCASITPRPWPGPGRPNRAVYRALVSVGTFFLSHKVKTLSSFPMCFDV